MKRTIPPKAWARVSFAAKANAKPPIPKPATSALTSYPKPLIMTVIVIIQIKPPDEFFKTAII